MLEPGGGLFVVSGGGISLQGSKSHDLQPKDAAIKRLVIKYLGPERRAGDSIYEPSDLNWQQNLFAKSKFTGFEKRVYKIKVVRNMEQELGNLYSMSWARRDFFGPKIGQFEAEFKDALLAVDPIQKFVNEVFYEAYFLAK